MTFEATIERSDVDDILIMMAEGIYEKIFQLRLKFDEVCSSFIEFGLRARLEDLFYAQKNRSLSELLVLVQNRAINFSSLSSQSRTQRFL